MLTNLYYLALTLIGFGVLIFVHELGHFVAAKWAGIRTEAFAIGMGPVALAWRKGIGFRFGSTEPEYERRVREFLNTDEVHQSSASGESKKAGGISIEQRHRIGDKLGLGETEYSLRWLPLGGFVKMLGQEDANPNAVSDDPRSYGRRPIGRRMVVVAAGVMMNLILATAIFMFVFLVGAPFDAPVIGGVAAGMPAASAKAVNAGAANLAEPGLQPGDVVLQIDDDPVKTFPDISIASAMGRPDVPLRMKVSRAGVAEPLEFDIKPQKDPRTGLMGIGVDPGRSTRIIDKDQGDQIKDALEGVGFWQAGVRPGMRLVRVAGREIGTLEEAFELVKESGGEPLQTEWSALDGKGDPTGPVIQATLPVRPGFQALGYVETMPPEVANYEVGLFGVTPLPKIRKIAAGSQNAGVLRQGDVILKVGGIDGPRSADLMAEVGRHKKSKLPLTVLRDGAEIVVDAEVDRKGKLNINLEPAWDLPVIATPMDKAKVAASAASAELEAQATPPGLLKLMGRTRIESVEGEPVRSWFDVRKLMRTRTAAAHEAGSGAAVSLGVILPTPGNPHESVTVELSPAQVAVLHKLPWQSDLPPDMFEPLQVTLTAEGNPVRAVAMGFNETRKAVVVTYLTIDRLFRGTVGVEQLRGPVGILHLGTKIGDKGLMYMLFFLGMISVNLAVINFLPLPIVDGGLFLFLVYEKLKGRPPSLAFQNAATIVGLCLIGAIFLVTFYNDVLRLFG